MPTDVSAPASRIPSWLEWVLTVALGLGVALLLRAFVIGVYLVPSGSMLDTIREGDHVLGEKISYAASSPRAGDIVTFADPDDASITLIKRVIATQGQTVDLRDGRLYVDDVEQVEDYVEGKPSYALQGHAANLAEDVSYPYTVPDGCVWVMGDNRTNSLDSRYFGAVSVNSISSKAVCIFWPFSDVRGL